MSENALKTKRKAEQSKQAREFLSSIIQSAVENEASDLHLRVGASISMRVDGRIRIVKGSPEVTDASFQHLFFPLLEEHALDKFKRDNQVDFAFKDDFGQRVRVNMYTTQLGKAAAIRIISNDIRTPDELGLPEEVEKVADYQTGLVLFCGATGSGKSTSMASLLNLVNHARYAHILTIEDPIEYEFKERRSIISQREIGAHVPDFVTAMKGAMREDPDVILMGEMRDLESIEAALTAASTGHLVFSTLHAPDSVEAVSRLISSFEGSAQSGVRAKLSQCLRAVITQHLLPKRESRGRVVACEVMTITSLARDLIAEPDRIRELKDLVASGEKVEGMLHFDEHLYRLVKERVISEDTALSHASSMTDLSLRLKGF